MKKEIGSEFCLEALKIRNLCDNQLFLKEDVLTFSGRTAIHAALQDAMLERPIRTAYVPSYCCASMLQPFNDLNINVYFYEVFFCNGLQCYFDLQNDVDVVLVMNCFGFLSDYTQDIIHQCLQKRVLIIEDITHSFLSTQSEQSEVDYQVASLRKWFPVASGGMVRKKKGKLLYPLCDPEETQISLRMEAMRDKALYLKTETVDFKHTKIFMTKYAQFNHSLENNYQNISIDAWSRDLLCKQDIQFIRKRRRTNATYLLDGLKLFSKITPVFDQIKKGDCPLFVPILVKNSKEIQQGLARASIFSPIHWPRPCVEASSNLYDLELSLVCDQRYALEDMKRILCTIKNLL